MSRIINAGFEAFHHHGYKLTQMSVIASIMDASVGSIYNYVKGKKALFELCLLEAFTENFLNNSSELPFEGMEHQKMVEGYISPSLERLSLEQKKYYRTNPLLNDVVATLFSYMSHYWKGIKLLDTTSDQWPSLYQLYYDFRSDVLSQLTQYVKHGVETGVFRPVQNIRLSSRLILENIAYFAMHRRYDMFLSDMDEMSALVVVQDAIVHAYQNTHVS